MDRRQFLQHLTVAAAVPALTLRSREADAELGPLLPDPGEILDLPEGYSYSVVSSAGDAMNDGLLVPQAHDGMAAFPGDNGRVILVCNHELRPARLEQSAFGDQWAIQPADVLDSLYDRGFGETPGCGGTTTTVYDPAAGRTERQHLSLGGTELNCAGGPTPWGTWLSCEECFENPGTGWSRGRIVSREKPHGYVFEVSAYDGGLAAPLPIKAMGKFKHEAAAVHEASGAVYMTEDRYYSLFYRYLPNTRERLLDGGRLQALAIADNPSFATHNWSARRAIAPGETLETRWIDLDDVDPEDDDLRLRGAMAGAATFARGEGLCADGDNIAFTCTIGGQARRGQVFLYRPSPHEGRPGEHEAPGRLTLVAESTHESILRHADNLTFAPWGDLIVCEDDGVHSGLIGVRPDGSQYLFADNAWSSSELAGVCFSPDGKILFVNVQYPGVTLAITGPFPAAPA